MQTLLRMKMKNEGNEGMPQNQNIQIIYKTTRLVEYDVYYIIIYEPIEYPLIVYIDKVKVPVLKK